MIHVLSMYICAENAFNFIFLGTHLLLFSKTLFKNYIGKFVILKHVLKYISKFKRFGGKVPLFFYVRNVQLRLIRNLSNSTGQKSAKISGEQNPGNFLFISWLYCIEEGGRGEETGSLI
jgi:hypothetical protein